MTCVELEAEVAQKEKLANNLRNVQKREREIPRRGGGESSEGGSTLKKRDMNFLTGDRRGEEGSNAGK